MAVWSARLAGDGRSHTFLKRVFSARGGGPLNFDILRRGGGAGARAQKEFEAVNQPPCWLSGSELTHMAETEDFQWIWGALLAFPGGGCRAERLRRVRALCPPGPPDEESWGVRGQFERTGAAFMIFAADSSLTELVSLDRDLIDCFCAHEPRAEVTKEQPE